MEHYEDAAVTVFIRNGGTGALTFVEAHFDVGTTSVTVSPDGAHVYVTGGSELAVFIRDAGTGTLTLAESPGALSSGTHLILSPDGDHVYVSNYHADVLWVFSRDARTGTLTRVETEGEIHYLLRGKKLFIKNKVPDDKERNKAAWITRRYGIEALSFSDPQCYSDPPGTVKASIRFFSASSGQDTGPIDLPCEKWSYNRRDDTRVFKYLYRDRALGDGPCSRVALRGDGHVWRETFHDHGVQGKKRGIEARCFGKGTTTDFLYDLKEGTDEGMVNVLLTTGRTTYCTASDDYKGRDGSDGRRFLGKEFPPPPLTRCPIPPGSPRAAFLDVTTGVLD